MEPNRKEQAERKWATLCHLSAALVYLGIPIANLLAPLTLWLIKRNESAFVDEQGKEAVNFQLSVLVYTLLGVLGLILSILVAGGLTALTEKPAFLGFGLLAVLFVTLLILLWVADLILLIVAAIRASYGEHYRYPLSLRLIK
jgi:uncharacterized Tic20 family protein